MIKELNNYENLGNPELFYELLNKISVQDIKWTEKNIDEYFYNRVIGGRFIFDGCLPLLEMLEIVKIKSKKVVGLNPTFLPYLYDENILSKKILEIILDKMLQDHDFYEIFSQENITYDIVNKLIQIERSAFPLRYTNILKLLLSFGFLNYHPEKNINKFILNQEYRSFFQDKVNSKIKRRKLRLVELKKTLENEYTYGEEGEAYVLEYERLRLRTHPKISNIEIVSQYDVAAGYDIVSYEDSNSDNYDRFIEVKSYNRDPRFYWSRNEIDTARIKKNTYFLYLIDREQINTEGYEPIIIRNPYENIVEKSSEWVKSVEKYLFTLIH